MMAHQLVIGVSSCVITQKVNIKNTYRLTSNRHHLTHWDRETHICISDLTFIGSDNSLSPGRCQAIIWTNAGLLLTGPLGILIKIQTFSFMEMHLKMSSAKERLFRLDINVLTPIASWTKWTPFSRGAWSKTQKEHYLILIKISINFVLKGCNWQ